MMGRKSANADDALKKGFVGAGFLPEIDLSSHLTEEWRDFNKSMIPVYLEQ